MDRQFEYNKETHKKAKVVFMTVMRTKIKNKTMNYLHFDLSTNRKTFSATFVDMCIAI